MKSNLFIIGGRSTAFEIREVIDYFFPTSYHCVYNVISDEEESKLQNTVRDSDLKAFLDASESISYILGITNYKLRVHFKKLFQEVGGEEVNVIHPKACLMPSVKLGIGNYIAANAVISSCAEIGDSNIINYNVTIGHDAMIGNGCIFNPGARVSGNVKIGNNCLLGANSFIFQGLTIGVNCSIDALTYIDRSVADNQMCTSIQGNLRVYKNCQKI